MTSTSSRITVVARVHAKDGREKEVPDQLVALLEPTRQEEGCLRYDLHTPLEAPGQFLFYETWEGRDHLERHARSPHIQAFRARSAGLLVAPTEITTWEAKALPGPPARGPH